MADGCRLQKNKNIRAPEHKENVLEFNGMKDHIINKPKLSVVVIGIITAAVGLEIEPFLLKLPV